LRNERISSQHAEENHKTFKFGIKYEQALQYRRMSLNALTAKMHEINNCSLKLDSKKKSEGMAHSQIA